MIRRFATTPLNIIKGVRMSIQVHDVNRHEAAQLRAHFRQCAFALGRMHRVRCMAEALDAFLAPRFVSVLTVMAAVVVVGASLSA
jgi:hypothetical protein